MQTFLQFQQAQELILEAAEACFGLDNLARVLGRSSEDICRWIAGAEPVPQDALEEASRVLSSAPAQPPTAM